MAKKNAKILKEISGDWTAAELTISYKHGLKCEKAIGCSIDAYLFFIAVWDKDLISLQEQTMALFLNIKGQVIGYRLLNTGKSSQCEVNYRLLVSLALHCMASRVVMAHNHPSGNVSPSDNDLYVTKQAKQSLRQIEVALDDHLVISDKNYYSFADHNKIC